MGILWAQTGAIGCIALISLRLESVQRFLLCIRLIIYSLAFTLTQMAWVRAAQ